MVIILVLNFFVKNSSKINFIFFQKYYCCK
nr:MAG TPA: hypothetical protein [Caudoviricetes sp.]